jgi:hypothetical protein
MKQAFGKKFARSVIVTALVTTVSFLPHSNVRASSDPNEGIPVELHGKYASFSNCSVAKPTFCISNFGIDFNNDGVFETPSPTSGISLQAYIFSAGAPWNTPSLSYTVYVNGSQDLAPTIPVGTAITMTVNTGTFEPNPELITDNDVESFSVTNIEGKWTTTATMRTTSKTHGEEAVEPKTNRLIYTKNLKDYGSVFNGVQFYEKPSTMREARRGIWVSSNASIINELKFLAKTMTWEVLLAGPARKENGAVNALTYSTFLPDTFIQYAYGTTPDVLVNALAATRTDGDVTITVATAIKRITSPVPGLLLTIPDIRLFGTVVKKQSGIRPSVSFSVQPRIRIKPKNPLLKAPTLRKTAALEGQQIRLTGLPVRGATKYQAMCSQGLKTTFATSKKPVVIVNVGAPGKWSCKLRGVQRIGGRWSKSQSVTLN